MCNYFVGQSLYWQKPYLTWNSFNFFQMWTFSTKILKIYLFSSSKLHKGVTVKIQISKLKNQSSSPQTISGSIDGNSRTCCKPKVFKKFPSGHEAITSCWRHYDPNFKWRRYSWSPWRMLVNFSARGSKTCLQTIKCLFITSKTAWHASNTCTCFKTSKRGISVICW